MSSQKLQAVLAKLTGVKQVGPDQYMAMCPRHDDHNASLAVAAGKNGGVVMHCHGCGAGPSKILPAIGMAMSDIMPDGHKPMRPEDMPDKGLTLDELARAKQLPLDFLKSLACRTVTNEKTRDDGSTFSWLEVLIPYFNADGTFAARHRRRFALTGDRRFAWTGTKAAGAIIPYGLHRLAAARTAGELVVVEGESDCWTLWHHGYAAIGFPGASMVGKLLKAEQLEGIGKIFVFREPDRGGQQFAAALLSRLKKLTWSGFAWVVSIPDVKDPSVLHLQNAAAFRPAFDAALKAAAPLGGDFGIVGQATSNPRGTPGHRPKTEFGNALRLLDTHAEDILFCRESGKVYVWDGKHWSTKLGLLEQWAANIIWDISKEYSEATADEAESLSKWAQRSQTSRMVKAIIECVKPQVEVSKDKLDADAFVLNCQNGIVDLHSGTLLPHDRSCFCTKIANAAYYPNTRHPVLDKFLSTSFPGRHEQLVYLKRAIGYSLTGSIREDKFFVCFGKGANGKSKLIVPFTHILGNYADVIPLTVLLERRGNSIPNDIAALDGLRFAMASEPEQDEMWKEGQVKAMTGREPVKGRFLYGELFTIHPKCKIWIACNSIPRIRSTDRGMLRRLQPIRFPVNLPEEQWDKDLEDKLIAEADGLLCWAVEGCMDYLQNGIMMTADMKEDMSIFMNESNQAFGFVDDCCLLAENGSASAKEVYTRYREWAEANGHHAMSMQKFMRLLYGMANVEKKHMSWGNAIKGLTLVEAQAPPADDDWRDWLPRSGQSEG